MLARASVRVGQRIEQTEVHATRSITRNAVEFDATAPNSTS